jgi:hypothetical protein
MAKQLTINERSTMLLPISFKDENGVLTVPETAVYRIDDPASFTAIVPRTALPLESSQNIEIRPDQNRIIDEQSTSEERVVTVDWTYHNNLRRGTDEYRYRVKNLYGVETILSVSASASLSPSTSISPSSSPSSSTSPSASVSPSGSVSPSASASPST